MASIYDWSVTPGSNSSSDAAAPWPEGMDPGQVNDSARQVMGRVAEILGDLGGALSAGGTANGLTVTANSAFTTLADGRIVSFRATASNSGAATLNVNGIGAKAIRKMTAAGDSAIGAGDIQNTGVYVAQYSAALNGAAGGWLLLNPTLSSVSALDFTLISTDAGAAAGPVFTRYRNSATPAASDIIAKDLDQGEDSAGNTEDYAERYTTIIDPTSTSEDATYTIRTKLAGTMTTNATFGGAVGALLPIVDINGGTIDGTVIGGASAAAATVTTLGATIGTFSTRTMVPSGTVANPSMGFTPAADSANGFYKPDPNTIGVSCAGAETARFSATAFIVGSDQQITTSGGSDVGFSAGIDGHCAILTSNDSGISMRRLGGVGGVIQTYVDGAGSACGNITTSTGATAFNTSSDKRKKENFRPFDSGAILDQLMFGQFEWIGTNQTGYGVLAQDAQAAFPLAISRDDDGWYSADYSKYVPVLAAEVQSLRRRVAELEAH